MKAAETSLAAGPSPIAGDGLFATAPMAPGARLLEYRGRLLGHNALADAAGVDPHTIAWLDADWLIDGGAAYNLGRLINHSCNPNAELCRKGSKLWIHALRWLGEGDEVTIHYNLTARDALRWTCRCGTPQCRGYAVGEPWKAELFRELARRSRNRRRRLCHEND